ncbi:response regulator transcription factor [Chloroflexota bacterium]
MRKYRILVVEDEERILNFLRSKLKVSGYEVLTANNGVLGLEQAQTQEPNLVVLDLLMPKMNGLEMLKELRAFSTVPVIILTAKDNDEDKIKGFQLGADDYLTKPFNPDELVARIEAVMRRVEEIKQANVPEKIKLGHTIVDFKRHAISVKGKEQYLTRTEWLLLSRLVNNAGRLMFYSDLLTHIWGPEYRDDIQLLRTCISRLRNKLEVDPDNPKLIRTIPKSGYIIDEPLS